MYEDQYCTEGTIDQAWQSDQFESIRNAFRQNQRHPACNTCWHQESVTDRSQRTAFTQKQSLLGNPPTDKLSLIHI